MKSHPLQDSVGLGYAAQVFMYLTWAASLAMFFVVGMYIATAMPPVMMALGMFLISPVMMMALREAAEGPLRRSFFDPRVMSYAFVVGDFVLLPLGFYFAARGWQAMSLTRPEFMMITVLSAGVGVAVMIGFQFTDGARYRKIGWGASLLSPTKSWHDLVVMPAVSAMAAWLLVPQVIAVMSFPGRHGEPMLLLYATIWFGAFLAACAKDMRTPPDPRHQHYRWSPKWFRPIGTI